MLVSDFSYDLPDECIASEPPKVRGTTRLLALNRQTGEITDSKYAKLADFLEPGDLIILNDTRVMRSRVFTELPDGRPRELVVLERHDSELNPITKPAKKPILKLLSKRFSATALRSPNAKLRSTKSPNNTATFRFHHTCVVTPLRPTSSATRLSGPKKMAPPLLQPPALI